MNEETIKPQKKNILTFPCELKLTPPSQLDRHELHASDF